MDKKKSTEYLHKLMQTEDTQLAKLHKIVQESLEEESLLTRKLLEDDDGKKLTYGERLADKVAKFGGSWTFIMSFGGVLVLWIASNSILLGSKAFDPYPYILLNLVLSCIAALQAPVIMMSQNRKETKDRERAEDDYLINLKSEIEIRHLHRKIDLSIVDQYQHLCDIQQKQLELLEELQDRLNKMMKDHDKGAGK
ncbi:MAG TPA: DUF1003 domain-containing protein [Saprospiraceae bacterium]|nr:DUF1003 domain-containing protein [Saprospiraceae bacterium]HPI06387.1 DUF1003 domain-containing protein [Saprospiraceae bacterium]